VINTISYRLHCERGEAPKVCVNLQSQRRILMTAFEKPNCRLTGLCQLRPAADIGRPGRSRAQTAVDLDTTLGNQTGPVDL
jgi:hypothetical protein